MSNDLEKMFKVNWKIHDGTAPFYNPPPVPLPDCIIFDGKTGKPIKKLTNRWLYSSGLEVYSEEEIE